MKSKQLLFVIGVLLLASFLAGGGSRGFAGSGNIITHCVPNLSIHSHCDIAYPTIQQAIDHADPGDRVQVGPGTYHEQLRIATYGLQLLGALDAATKSPLSIIDGTGFPPGAPLVLITDADGVEIRGFTLHSSAVAAIALHRSHFCHIYRNTFSIAVACDPAADLNCPPQVSGIILADGATYNDIDENSLQGDNVEKALLPQRAFGGILLQGPIPGALKTQHNTVRNNLVRGFGVGIGDFGGRNNILRCNTVIENFTGIKLFWTYGAQVYSNEANQNGAQLTGGGGICVQSSDGSGIADNEANGNTDFGLSWERVGLENPFTSTDPNLELLNTLNDRSGIVRNDFRGNRVQDISIGLHFPDDGQRSADPADDPGRCNVWVQNKISGGMSRTMATPCS